jgi:multiple sugar transport system ATP-binding protein
MVTAAEHLGSDTFLYVDAGPVGTLTARYIGELNLSAGDKVSLSPEPARIHRFDASGNAIRM